MSGEMKRCRHERDNRESYQENHPRVSPEAGRALEAGRHHVLGLPRPIRRRDHLDGLLRMPGPAPHGDLTGVRGDGELLDHPTLPALRLGLARLLRGTVPVLRFVEETTEQP